MNEDVQIYFAEFGEQLMFTGSGNEKEIDAIFDRQIIDSFLGDITVSNKSITCLVKTEDVEDWTLNATIVRKEITYYSTEIALTDNDDLSLLTLSLDKVQ